MYNINATFEYTRVVPEVAHVNHGGGMKSAAVAIVADTGGVRFGYSVPLPLYMVIGLHELSTAAAIHHVWSSGAVAQPFGCGLGAVPWVINKAA